MNKVNCTKNQRVIVALMCLPLLLAVLVFAALLSGCAPESVTTTWTPRQVDPGIHLFYQSPVTQDVAVNGAVVTAWDGDKANQVSVLECSSTQARIADGVWVARSLLLADWCDAGIYERVK